MSTAYPVLEVIDDLRHQLFHHPTVILQAPPGAGKSTVLPLQLLDEPWLKGKKMIMLEPRRLAARSVAYRMASLAGEQPGDTVGYRIRFETNVSEKTRIEVVTEGVLTRMIQTDNALDGVGLVVFDEFHERSLQADLALALCLQVQAVLRTDLRILIMSATLDGEGLSEILDHAPVVTCFGKQFPVEFRYYNVDPDAPLPVRMARAIRKALVENTGDLLAFLPGAGEIRRTQELLQADGVGATIRMLYGDLPMKKQQEAILPDAGGNRKIVLSTSLAETSLTIEGITVVVDGGCSRVPRFDPRSGLTRLETIRVTRDSAAQRAGRAGRLGPGVCYRLWSEATQANLAPHRTPEIADADLAQLLLEVSLWGVRDINELSWITPPPPGAVSQATELLEQLDALKDGKITDRGKRMLQLPTHPRLAHMLLEAKNESSSLSVATDLAAILEERDPLPKEVGVDLTLRLEALRKWRMGDIARGDKNTLERIERLAESWRRIFSQAIDNSIPADTDVGKLVASAYPERIAQQQKASGERYKQTSGRSARLPTNDPLTREPWLAVAHADGGGEGKIFLAAPVDKEDLMSRATQGEFVRWDEVRGMVTGTIERRLGSLVLETRPLAVIPSEDRVRILCEAVRLEGLRILGWSDTEREWQARVMSLRTWRPQDGWPDVTDEVLLATLETWLTPYLSEMSRRSDLLRLDLSAILAGLLPWNLQGRLESLAVRKVEVPSGSAIKLNYSINGQPPVMEVRLQEVFGLLETPTVNEGSVRVVLHLLSPGYKPVQVTQDLKSFWNGAYHEVRKELRIRYRKHSWPEDPWTAQAVRGALRKRT